VSKFLFVIGYPVEHSKSPEIHNKVLDSLGLLGDYIYAKAEIKKIEDVKKLIKMDSFHGASITMPHKEKIIPYLDEISKEALFIEAVNTIVKKNNKIYGYNTDWYGVKKTLETEIPKKELKKKEVLIIGSGGAAKSIVYALKELDMKITIFSRSKKI
jgi:shikimate dehydrogenase